MYPNSTFSVPHLSRVSGQRLCSEKEDSGRPPLLVPPKNGGDETNHPSPPNFTFFDDPDVSFGPCGPPPPPGRPGPPGLPLGWPPAPSPAGDTERVRTGNTSRERLHPRSPPPEPRLFQIPMSDGEDGQPPQDERRRERSYRVSEYILTNKCQKYHKFNLWLLQNLMMYQMRTLQL